MVKHKKLRKKRPVSAKLNALWTEFKRTGAHDLREQLIERYLPCARAMAERTKAKLPENVDINDLYSAGLLGLMDAVNKFEPERGIRFETYCSLRIRGQRCPPLAASISWALIRTCWPTRRTLPSSTYPPFGKSPHQ